MLGVMTSTKNRWPWLPTRPLGARGAGQGPGFRPCSGPSWPRPAVCLQARCLSSLSLLFSETRQPGASKCSLARVSFRGASLVTQQQRAWAFSKWERGERPEGYSCSGESADPLEGGRLSLRSKGLAVIGAAGVTRQQMPWPESLGRSCLCTWPRHPCLQCPPSSTDGHRHWRVSGS